MKSNTKTSRCREKGIQLVLLGSGLVAILIAITILFAPTSFYSGYQIDVANNATLLNELKAPAGALLVAGALMLAGVFRAGLVSLSLTAAAVVYLSYGVSRAISFVVDGLPHEGMISAAGIELLIGTICLLLLLQSRNSSQSNN